MRLCVIQMDMRLGESAYNFAHAEALLRRAAAEGADTALLPETWNAGFFPTDHLPERSDRGGGGGEGAVRAARPRAEHEHRRRLGLRPARRARVQHRLCL